MAERKPLVLDANNRLSELPAGDTLPSSALPPGGSGTVTSVDASRGVRTASGSAITTSGTLYADCPVNAQAGTSYTVAATDRGGLITHSNASATAYTLPQAGTTGFEAGWFTRVQNNGAGAVTITPTTSTINGSATLVLTQNEWAVIVSDGTNYSAQQVALAKIGGTPATGKVPTVQSDGVIEWETPSGGGGGGSVIFDDGGSDSDGFFVFDEGGA